MPRRQAPGGSPIVLAHVDFLNILDRVAVLADAHLQAAGEDAPTARQLREALTRAAHTDRLAGDIEAARARKSRPRRRKTRKEGE